MRYPRVLLTITMLGITQHLHAAVYVDPSNAGTLMSALAPVFIVISALGLYFKRGIIALFRRVFKKPNSDEGHKP